MSDDERTRQLFELLRVALDRLAQAVIRMGAFTAGEFDRVSPRGLRSAAIRRQNAVQDRVDDLVQALGLDAMEVCVTIGELAREAEDHYGGRIDAAPEAWQFDKAVLLLWQAMERLRRLKHASVARRVAPPDPTAEASISLSMKEWMNVFACGDYRHLSHTVADRPELLLRKGSRSRAVMNLARLSGAERERYDTLVDKRREQQAGKPGTKESVARSCKL